MPTKRIYAGEVINIERDAGDIVRIQHNGQGPWYPLLLHQPVYVGDVVVTTDCVACLEFTNGRQLGIGRNCVVEITSPTGARDITPRPFGKRACLFAREVWSKVTGTEGDDCGLETTKGVVGLKG